MEFVNRVEEADIILFGAAVDQGTENKGCIDAPAKVREHFDGFYLSETAHINRVLDKSDVVEEKSFETTMDKLYNKTIEFLHMRKPFICIGGNHSISLPIVQALSRFYSKIGIIHIDAHPDCQVDYFPYGDVIGGISKIPEVKKIIQLGIRNWSKDEYQFLLENKINFYTASELFEKGVDPVLANVEETLRDCDCVYITFDIDAIDPAFAPATGCIEPGGLSSREAIRLLQRLATFDNVKGMDLVEINPGKDISENTSVLGAKLVFEFANSLKL